MRKNVEKIGCLEMAMRVRARVCNAKTGLPESKWLPWKKNLVLDLGLNAFAASTHASTPANGFLYCQVGTSATPNYYDSGAVTFTQTGTTVTATGAFFTSAMVGAILKYGTGTGGAEQYIVSQTGTACVVAGAGMTVGATVGTVWLVQQASLVALLTDTNTYQTTGSSCGTVYVANVMTMQRTFNFAVQGSNYNANEIGYANTSTTYSFGRIVLASTIVVSTAQFLQVQLQMIMTCSPSTPTAVGNVGTGINTAGTAMLECLAFSYVHSNGTTGSGTGYIDPATSNQMANIIGITSPITQNSTPTGSDAGLGYTYYYLGSTTSPWTYSAGTVGVCTASFTSATFTTSGETMYSIALTNAQNTAAAVFDVLLTTPITLPTGTFQPQFIFQLTYSRTLNNV